VTSASASRSASSLPFTPFHFGPGLLCKGLAPRWCSWTAFVASNVIIDCESLYYLVRREYPVHRELHTFVGATLVALVTIGLLLAIRRILSRRWLDARGPTVRAELSTLGIAVGAMLGALSHPVLDGLMHRDIEPFAPWTAENPLRDVVELGALHLGCAVAGLVGAVLLVVSYVRERN
jgi:hypothetical protein